MRDRLRWLVAPLAVMTLLAAGCSAEGEVDVGNDSPAGSPTDAGEDGPGVDIGVGVEIGDEGLVATDNEFDPAEFSISSGESFELTNEGEAEHNFTLEDAGLDEDVEPGGSTTITLDLEPGTYDYVCEYHEADGMVGTVTVE